LLPSERLKKNGNKPFLEKFIISTQSPYYSMWTFLIAILSLNSSIIFTYIGTFQFNLSRDFIDGKEGSAMTFFLIMV
jgi:hypothetical protein